MSSGVIIVKKSGPLHGEVALSGAKNAVLAIMASMLLTKGVSILRNVPDLSDVRNMIKVLESVGVKVFFDAADGFMEIDTREIVHAPLDQDGIRKFRASLLVFGPLLARFKEVKIAMPGGDQIGIRPIDYHIKNFIKMGAHVHQDHEYLYAETKELKSQRFILDYPSVGTTENLMMALVIVPGESWIVNAALEPEVLDVITVLQKMGADIDVVSPAMIRIRGVGFLKSIEHVVMPDRLEAGSLLIAAAISKGNVSLPDANANHMELFLMKLEEMGHKITVGPQGRGVRLDATPRPLAVSFKTGPYPGFATDLQALMMVAQCVAHGSCEIVETVFENRFLHVPELNKMGTNIQATGHFAKLYGTTKLQGAEVVATDIRAACALALAGCVADGETVIQNGAHHWRRGYETLDEKLRSLGAQIEIRD